MAKAIASTQQHLDIASVRDGIVYAKNGTLKALVGVTPVNFALKSEEDQDVLINQFQSFLNALYFPIQIVVQSRRIDVSGYLKGLKAQVENEGNELLRIQGEEYIDFITQLTTLANIMAKRFYLVVSYDVSPTEPRGGLLGLFGNKGGQLKYTAEQLKKYQEELKQRVNVVASGLQAMGLPAVPLKTQELVELYYGVYNPDEGAFEQLTESGSLQAEVVQAKK